MRPFFSSAVAVSLFLLATVSGAASRTAKPLVLSATPDLTAGVLVITGDRLQAPSVTLNGETLAVSRANRELIVARLPSPHPAPGTYLLTVAHSAAADNAVAFQVTIPSAPADSPAAARKPGNGSGGIPEVLAQLEQVRQQVVDSQAALEGRLNQLEAQVSAHHGFLEGEHHQFLEGEHHQFLEGPHHQFLEVRHHESVQPCTPEQWREDRCAGRDHPLQMNATFCFTLDLGAQADFGFALEPGIEMKGGAGWYDGPKGNLDVSVDIPAFFPVGPALVPFPDFALGAGAGGSGSIELCFSGLSFDGGLVPADLAQQAPDDFVQQLIDSIELNRARIVDAAINLSEERNLDPERLADAIDLLGQLKATADSGEDPLAVFQQGLFRDFVDALPVDDELKALLDNPAQVLPTFDPDDAAALCDRLAGMPNLSTQIEPICAFMKTMPDLAVVASQVRDIPDNVLNNLCNASSLLECGSPTRTCKQACADEFDDCVDACGPLDSRCRRECRQAKRQCKSSC